MHARVDVGSLSIYVSGAARSRSLSKKAAGHVWYDFFWDVVPHTDRHKKLWPAPWSVTFGP